MISNVISNNLSSRVREDDLYKLTWWYRIFLCDVFRIVKGEDKSLEKMKLWMKIVGAQQINLDFVGISMTFVKESGKL